MAVHTSTLSGKYHGERSLVGYSRVPSDRHDLQLNHHH